MTCRSGARIRPRRSVGPYGVGVIGESGSGKTTIARGLVRLHPVTAGSVVFDGQSVLAMRRGTLSTFRRDVQLVFQDGEGSLDPRMSVFSNVSEPYAVHGTILRGSATGPSGRAHRRGRTAR